jgi:hypothetical protein
MNFSLVCIGSIFEKKHPRESDLFHSKTSAEAHLKSFVGRGG